MAFTSTLSATEKSSFICTSALEQRPWRDRMLDGVFAFIVVDTKKNQVHLGRDIFGVKPMFTLYCNNGKLPTFALSLVY